MTTGDPETPKASRARSPREARLGITLFLIMIPVLVAGPLAIRSSLTGHPALLFACLAALTWTPALASVITRLKFGDGFSDVSFRLGPAARFPAFGVAFAMPLAIGLVGYGAAWSSGLAHFRLPVTAPWPSALPALRFGGLLAANLAHGLPRWTFLAIGEEIGWRGYLLPRLIESAWPQPVLLTGLIWGAWHVPSVLWGTYPAGPDRALSAVVIVVTLGSFAFILARLRCSTGSLWPAVAAHAAWNSILIDSFDGATRSATVWTRESGVLIAVVTLLAAAWYSRGAWEVRMSPIAVPFTLRPGRR
jgi:membrane protease YdiL (CAAX protease family)